ncbi:MAG TPA: inositol monophosphatase family protein [Solirubrobacteraceae bacterium]|jgi:myo-inositol-1(or 4)-monophosphatase|nr:inositol monophosphatase family protein [Solirubrobacteraceae bacterium]
MAAAPADLLAVAERAAREAGALLAERFRAGRESSVVAKSTPTDLASEADVAAERVIRALLARERPADGVLGEEEGGDVAPPGRGEVRWVIDPLDGTINYLFRVPQWCVSVACEDAEGTIAGAVFDPLRDELFAAARDGGALLNGAPVERAPRRPFEEALVATGFAYDAAVRARQAPVVAALLPRVRDVRRMGSAALDLAWLAAGRYDAYFERTVKPWDVAAGALLCRRAGLDVRDLPARDGRPYGIMAGRGELLDALARFDP